MALTTDTKRMIWFCVFVIMVVMFMGKTKESGWGKDASAGLEASRTFSKYTCQPGETITATYHPNSPNYIGIIEPVPGGWSVDKTVSPDNQVRTTADGNDINLQWTAPTTEGTYTFNGKYFVSPDVDYTFFPQDIITVSQSTTTFSCTGAIPQYTTLCTGDNIGLTQNTLRVVVASCDTAKCEYVCNVGYHKSGSQCVEDQQSAQTCTEAGYYCCVSPKSCSTPISGFGGCEGTCCVTSSACGISAQTCSQLGGIGCASNQICSGGTMLSVSDTQKCCTGGTCQTEVVPPTNQTCEEINKCDIWEQCDDKGTDCEIASWVYIIAAFMGFMFLWSMVK